MANEIAQYEEKQVSLNSERSEIGDHRNENAGALKKARDLEASFSDAVENQGRLDQRTALEATRDDIVKLTEQRAALDARDMELTNDIAALSARISTAHDLARVFDLSDEQRDELAVLLTQSGSDRAWARRLAQGVKQAAPKTE